MTPKERLVQALMASQAVVQPTNPSAMTPPAAAMPPAAMPPGGMSPGAMPGAAMPPSPYLLNQPMEDAAQAQGQAAPLHPLVAAIMKHMGLLNVVRNRNNQMTVDPETPTQ